MPNDPRPHAVRVGDVASLQEAVRDLVAGATIVIEPGQYHLSETLLVDGVDGVTLRGASGRCGDVVLRGRGMREADYGAVPQVIRVRAARGVRIADLTVADAWKHDIQVMGETGCQDFRLDNVHLLDSGEQLLKVSYNPDSPWAADGGRVERCRFEYSDCARDWYSNGVDVLRAAHWVVRDNHFVRIRGPEGEMCGPAVLFFGGSRGARIEDNHFHDCDVAIGAGIFSGEVPYSHRDAVIRGNTIYRDRRGGDAGIVLGLSHGFCVCDNTILLNGTAPHTILYGDHLSFGQLRHNVADGPFQATDDTASLDPWSPQRRRDPSPYRASGDGRVALVDNATTARADAFVDAAGGNFEPRPSAPMAS